jgi:hypothetical protein
LKPERWDHLWFERKATREKRLVTRDRRWRWWWWWWWWWRHTKKSHTTKETTCAVQWYCMITKIRLLVLFPSSGISKHPHYLRRARSVSC